MTELEELKKKKVELVKLINWVSRDINESYQVLEGYKNRHDELLREYKEVDEKLAMIDGRFKKVENSGNPKKKIELTQDQILDVAKKLGIKIKSEYKQT